VPTVDVTRTVLVAGLAIAIAAVLIAPAAVSLRLRRSVRRIASARS
jgi:hypothetical protein